MTTICPVSGHFSAIRAALKAFNFNIGDNDPEFTTIQSLIEKGYDIALAIMGSDFHFGTTWNPDYIRDEVVKSGWELYVPQELCRNADSEIRSLLFAETHDVVAHRQLRGSKFTLCHLIPEKCRWAWENGDTFVVFRHK